MIKSVVKVISFMIMGAIAFVIYQQFLATEPMAPADIQDTAAVEQADARSEAVTADEALDPLCFVKLASANKIDFADCRAGYTIRPSLYEEREGFIGTAYYTGVETEQADAPAFVQYRDLGLHQDLRTVLVEWNFDGSGYFSGIYQIETNEQTLRIVNRIAAGNTCHNGVTDVRIVGDDLIYNVFFTPRGLWGLIPDVTVPRYFVLDLEDCLECCYGKARFKNGMFQGASFLLTEGQLLPRAARGKSRQQCFNTLLHEQVTNTGPDINIEGVQNFAAQFQRDCADRKYPEDFFIPEPEDPETMRP